MRPSTSRILVLALVLLASRRTSGQDAAAGATTKAAVVLPTNLLPANSGLPGGLGNLLAAAGVTTPRPPLKCPSGFCSEVVPGATTPASGANKDTAPECDTLPLETCLDAAMQCRMVVEKNADASTGRSLIKKACALVPADAKKDHCAPSADNKIFTCYCGTETCLNGKSDDVEVRLQKEGAGVVHVIAAWMVTLCAAIAMAQKNAF